MTRISCPISRAFSSVMLNGLCANRFVNHSNGCCAGFSPASLFTRPGKTPPGTLTAYEITVKVYAEPEQKSIMYIVKEAIALK